MSSIIVRFATNYHLHEGVPFVDAMEYADNNPEIVEEWARRNGLDRLH